MSISIKSSETPDVTDVVELFELDDKKYFIPAVPRLNISLKYLRLARKEGQAAAIAYLLEALLGEDGFEALTDYDKLTKEQFQAVVKAAQKVALGTLEPSKS